MSAPTQPRLRKIKWHTTGAFSNAWFARSYNPKPPADRTDKRFLAPAEFACPTTDYGVAQVPASGIRAYDVHPLEQTVWACCGDKLATSAAMQSIGCWVGQHANDAPPTDDIKHSSVYRDAVAKHGYTYPDCWTRSIFAGERLADTIAQLYDSREYAAAIYHECILNDALGYCFLPIYDANLRLADIWLPWPASTAPIVGSCLVDSESLATELVKARITALQTNATTQKMVDCLTEVMRDTRVAPDAFEFSRVISGDETQEISLLDIATNEKCFMADCLAAVVAEVGNVGDLAKSRLYALQDAGVVRNGSFYEGEARAHLKTTTINPRGATWNETALRAKMRVLCDTFGSSSLWKVSMVALQTAHLAGALSRARYSAIRVPRVPINRLGIDAAHLNSLRGKTVVEQWIDLNEFLCVMAVEKFKEVLGLYKAARATIKVLGSRAKFDDDCQRLYSAHVLFTLTTLIPYDSPDFYAAFNRTATAIEEWPDHFKVRLLSTSTTSTSSATSSPKPPPSTPTPTPTPASAPPRPAVVVVPDAESDGLMKGIRETTADTRQPANRSDPRLQIAAWRAYRTTVATKFDRTLARRLLDKFLALLSRPADSPEVVPDAVRTRLAWIKQYDRMMLELAAVELAFANTSYGVYPAYAAYVYRIRAVLMQMFETRQTPLPAAEYQAVMTKLEDYARRYPVRVSSDPPVPKSSHQKDVTDLVSESGSETDKGEEEEENEEVEVEEVTAHPKSPIPLRVVDETILDWPEDDTVPVHPTLAAHIVQARADMDTRGGGQYMQARDAQKIADDILPLRKKYAPGSLSAPAPSGGFPPSQPIVRQSRLTPAVIKEHQERIALINGRLRNQNTADAECDELSGLLADLAVTPQRGVAEMWSLVRFVLQATRPDREGQRLVHKINEDYMPVVGDDLGHDVLLTKDSSQYYVGIIYAYDHYSTLVMHFGQDEKVDIVIYDPLFMAGGWDVVRAGLMRQCREKYNVEAEIRVQPLGWQTDQLPYTNHACGPLSYILITRLLKNSPPVTEFMTGGRPESTEVSGVYTKFKQWHEQKLKP